jgi:hypothetical protein
MIFQIRHYCPDCRNLVDFTVSQVGEIVKREPDPNDPAKFKPVPKRPNQVGETGETVEGCALSRCPHCAEPLLIVFRTTRHLLQEAHRLDNTERTQHNPLMSRLQVGDTVLVLKTYPESKQPIAHLTWPEKIRRPFVDLQMMQSEKKHPSFIIGGCRTILDVATKDLGGKKHNLVDRIDELANMNIVTGVLKDWAHKLRLDGNAAVHELDGTDDDATQLVEFIKLFLHVAYELPEAILTKAPPGTVSSTAQTPGAATPSPAATSP